MSVDVNMSAERRHLDTSLFRRRGTPIILQTEAAECGMACLAMIAGHYGHRIDLPALRGHYNISLKGMTLHDVVRVASQMRLSTRALRPSCRISTASACPAFCTGTTTTLLC